MWIRSNTDTDAESLVPSESPLDNREQVCVVSGTKCHSVRQIQMCDQNILNDLMYIADSAVAPFAAHELVSGTRDLSLTPQLLQLLAKIFNVPCDSSSSHLSSVDDIILTETQRLTLEQFLRIVSRVPSATVRLRQRHSRSDPNDSIDLSVYHNLKFLNLEHINLAKLRCTGQIKSQLVTFRVAYCSEIEAVFCDKLSWAELVDLTLNYCRLEPFNNAQYFRNACWLRILNLSHCKLKRCDFLVNLSFLEHLNLSFNNIKSIPALNENCELKTLKIDNNFIQDLHGIENVPSVKYLDLSFNWLPNQYSLKPLEKAANLMTIKLAGNPVSFIKYYRVYVVMYMCTTTTPAHVRIDGVALNKTEQSVLGLSSTSAGMAGLRATLLLKDPTEIPPEFISNASSSEVISSSGDTDEKPSTSTANLSESYKTRPKKSFVRVPVIHDESVTPSSEPINEPTPTRTDQKPEVRLAPSVFPTGPIVSVNEMLTDELRAIQTAILRDPKSLLAVSNLTLETPEQQPRSKTVSWEMSLDDNSPVTEIVPETVVATVHAPLEVESSLKSEETSQETAEERENCSISEGSQSWNPFANNNPEEVDRNSSRTGEFSLQHEDVLNLKSSESECTALESNIDAEPISEQDIHNQDLSSEDNSSLIGNKSGNEDMAIGSTNAEQTEGFVDHDQTSPSVEISDEEPASLNSEDPKEMRRAADGEQVDANNESDKESEKSRSSSNPSDEESCYESDTDADEFLWHVTCVDPTTNVHRPIFLALLENTLKERSPKSGQTLCKWSLDMVLSCVKTKNDPITIEMEFDTTKKDKQYREYIMEYADAQALTKKVYQVLESRPLSATNQVPLSCSTCGTVFVSSSSPFLKTIESDQFANLCPVCGSSKVVETEEPKKPDKCDPPAKRHSPSQSSIGSARSMEQNSKTEGFNRRKCESDIEVISNPSQSSIEVIDESSRSQSVTPMRKKSEERQPTSATEHNLHQVLSPLSALTESSSSGSLTESVITAYETSSVIINKKSVECLPEASCENSPRENTISIASTGTTGEENGNLPSSEKIKDVYSFTDFLDVDLRVKTFIYHSVFKGENEELRAVVRCHIWKTGGSDYDGCFVLSDSKLYFLHHKFTDFSDQICDWLSLNESYQVTDLKRIQPTIWYSGVEIQIKNFSFILLLLDGDRTQNLTQHLSSLSLKGVKILNKPNPKIELALQQSVLSNDLNHNSEDPSVLFVALCRSLEITKVEVEEEEILRLAGLVLTAGLFVVIPGDLSWMCTGAQPSIVTSRDLSSLIEVKIKGKTQLVFHFLDEAEAVEELWSIKFAVDTQQESLLSAIRRPWERRFSVPLEITRS